MVTMGALSWAGGDGLIQIWTQRHAQTQDNVDDIASGHNDVVLTDAGRARASTEFRQRYASQHFDAAFASDLQRAYGTAKLILEGRAVEIVQDPRLRECDYGDLTGRPRSETAAFRQSPPHTKFPNGESYADVATRFRSFLQQLAAERDGQTVLIIGHGATFWMLKHLVQGLSLVDALTLPPEPAAYFECDPGQLQ